MNTLIDYNQEYLFSQKQIIFRQNLKKFFNREDIKSIIKNSKRTIKEPDPRPIYKAMGKEKILAVNLPIEFGGLGSSIVDAAIVAEEMVSAGIPETLYMLSVQFAGNLIAQFGSSEQKKHFLPSMAQGEKYACILYSEPQAGSDLAALETEATKINDDEFQISGKKIYSLKTHLADYGLCAARTKKSNSKYEGITLFMIPLLQERVKIKQVASLADETFHEVVFDKALTTKDAIIGDLNNGWALINKALLLERTGLDFLLKAKQALNTVGFLLSSQESLHKFETSNSVQRLIKRYNAIRLISYQLLFQYQTYQYLDETKAAITKRLASELTTELLTLGFQNLNLNLAFQRGYAEQVGSFDSIYRDTPGVTISAGTSEMMLETIAKLQFQPKGEI